MFIVIVTDEARLAMVEVVVDAKTREQAIDAVKYDFRRREGLDPDTLGYTWAAYHRQPTFYMEPLT